MLMLPSCNNGRRRRRRRCGHDVYCCSLSASHVQHSSSSSSTTTTTTSCSGRCRPSDDQIVLLERWTRLLDCVNHVKILFYEVISNDDDQTSKKTCKQRQQQSRWSTSIMNLMNINRMNHKQRSILNDIAFVRWMKKCVFFLVISFLISVMSVLGQSARRTINCLYLFILLILLSSHSSTSRMYTLDSPLSSKEHQHDQHVHHHHKFHHHHHHHHHQQRQSFDNHQSSRSSIESHQSFHSSLLSAHLQHASETMMANDQAFKVDDGHHTQIYVNRPYELAQTKCIARCSCKWRSGKMWVECPDASLHHVPKGLDSGTQVLYLSGNPLTKLEARAFERVELRNLQRLYLENCRLNEIHVDALQQLSNLIELDLAHNELLNLPTNSLVHCPILRKLSLAHNRILVIPNSAFSNLIHLQSIDFSANRIELIEQNAFYGLKNLKQLYLHENKLRYIDGQTMKSLPAVYELTLHHNPWRCDCSLRTFREWMIEHRIPLSYSPNCSSPERLKGRVWNQLDLDEFACQPIVVSVDTEVVLYEGENASIGCVMEAVPNVHIEWEWRGRTIRNMSLMTFGRQMYLIRESYSPSGVMMSLMPVDTGRDTSTLDLITSDSANDQQQQQQQQKSADSKNDNSMLYASYSSDDDGSQLKSVQHESIIIPSASNYRRFGRSSMDHSSSSSSLQTSNGLSQNDNQETTYKRTSTLYIMNALEKDSGSYVCNGYNKAGSVSANVTLTVLRRLEVTAAAYSGQEVAGLVIGVLFIFLLILIVIFSVVLRSRKLLPFRTSATNRNCNNGQQQSNNSNGGQTILGSTVISDHYSGTNGRIPNGHIQTESNSTNTTIPNGTLRRSSNFSNTNNHETSTKTSNLIVSLNETKANNSLTHHHYIEMDNHNENSNNNSFNHSKMNILNNQLAEQIELCDYGLNKMDPDKKSPLTTKCPMINNAADDSSEHLTSGSFRSKAQDTINQQQLSMSMSNDMANIINGTTTLKNMERRQYLFTNEHNGSMIMSNHYDSRIITNSIFNNTTNNKTTLLAPTTMCLTRTVLTSSPVPLWDHHFETNSHMNSANNQTILSTADNNRLVNGQQLAMARLIDAKHGNGQTMFNRFNNENNIYNNNSVHLANDVLMENIHHHSPYHDQQRHAVLASSLVQELQNRFNSANQQQTPLKGNPTSNMDSPYQASPSSSSSGQMVRFANSPTVYNYSTFNTINKQASPLNRIRNDGNPIIARDSPDEGLGEETAE